MNIDSGLESSLYSRISLELGKELTQSKQADLSKATQLIIKIAKQEGSATPAMLATRKISAQEPFLSTSTKMEIEPAEEKSPQVPQNEAITVDQISKIYGHRVFKLISEGFPFSKVQDEIAQEALTIPTEYRHDDSLNLILTAMVKAHIKNNQLVPDSPVWKELKSVVDNLSPDVLANALSYNYNSCREDPLSAPCFHTLLKMAINENYSLPKIENCTGLSLNDGIKECFAKMDFSKLQNPTRIVDLILCGSSCLFAYVGKPAFFDLAQKCLAQFPFDKWPGKGDAITNLLGIFNPSVIANILATSVCDAKTQEIGLCFQKCLEAKTAQEKFSLLHKMTELLPKMESHEMAFPFNYPYPSWDIVRIEFRDPMQISHLNCQGQVSQPVLFHGDLVMKPYRGKLLAFNKIDNRPVWSIPMKENPIYAGINKLGLTIISKNDPNNIHIFNPVTGKPEGVIPLPQEIKINHDWLGESVHISPSGFCYIYAPENNKLMIHGGQISNGKFNQAFPPIVVPKGDLHPLGNYVYFSHYGMPTTIIGQDGKQEKLAECDALFVKNGKLFTMEMTGKYQGSILAMQPIEDSVNFKLKGERKQLPLNTASYKLQDICDDETAVCLHGENVCFMNMTNGQNIQRNCEIPSYGKVIVDPKKGEVWSWDVHSKALWKHTKNDSTEIGHMGGGQGTSLAHIDNDGKLYTITT